MQVIYQYFNIFISLSVIYSLNNLASQSFKQSFCRLKKQSLNQRMNERVSE